MRGRQFADARGLIFVVFHLILVCSPFINNMAMMQFLFSNRDEATHKKKCCVHGCGFVVVYVPHILDSTKLVRYKLAENVRHGTARAGSSA